MKITFAIDEQVAQHAIKAAQKIGKSLDQVVLDYLEQLARRNQSSDQWTQFETRCLQSTARLDGWKFNREEARRC